jgi:potassium efflux system protein
LLRAEQSESPATVRIQSPIATDQVRVESQLNTNAVIQDAASQEFQDLLHYACVIALVCGGWFIWSEVLPALRILDRVELWQNIETIAETVVGKDGTESIQSTERTVPTTLTDLLTAIVICIATIMVGRRLPGLLELTFLDRLPVDQGGRQAIAILVRYAATVVGLLFACTVIRLSWSSVQWLAAAMTVGLGFGLQEIFANLVSGLIILFERPIRAGDLVTVGDLTGNVTHMRMRATTITDYDRRELIVPNKKFITDNVINWTLSDPISRVVLPVGVAYGSDIAQVQGILMRIAEQSPMVLSEPEPTTLFKGFGDSTLDMELRVFIPKRDVYVNVVNDINAAINREFARAGIEIAFPQCDFNIKSVDSLGVLVPQREIVPTSQLPQAA